VKLARMSHTKPVKHEQWREFAPHIVAEQMRGFDWFAYRSRMDDIRADSKVLQDEPLVREMHSRFARILLAYVQLAEADLEAARKAWHDNVPAEIGTPSFLNPKWVTDFSRTPAMAHLAINGKPTGELWNLVRRSIHHRQDGGDMLVVLDPIDPDAVPDPAPQEDASCSIRV
jgi:hypothetical protein